MLILFTAPLWLALLIWLLSSLGSRQAATVSRVFKLPDGRTVALTAPVGWAAESLQALANRAVHEHDTIVTGPDGTVLATARVIPGAVVA